MQRALLAAFAVVLMGAAPIDSQVVLAKYAHALADVATPKISIFSYAVSQAGPTDIEQRHRIYRSGAQVRDEIVSVDGTKPKLASISIGRREDRYAVARLAPRASAYEMLFVRAVVTDGRTDYLFDATPYVKATTGFVVTRVTIDGKTFLPRSISFRTASPSASGAGEIAYAPFGSYWMPVLASISATVAGAPARERIAFGEYRFPTSLPPSTFGKR